MFFYHKIYRKCTQSNQTNFDTTEWKGAEIFKQHSALFVTELHYPHIHFNAQKYKSEKKYLDSLFFEWRLCNLFT